VQLYGGEAIRRNGNVLGVTSSAGWGHTIGKAVAFGYVPAEEADHADYAIEAFTRRHAATRIDGAAVDAQRKKILS
jgi:4-methylaminobutanoate oxidase (formaldehyde-forming)